MTQLFSKAETQAYTEAFLYGDDPQQALDVEAAEYKSRYKQQQNQQKEQQLVNNAYEETIYDDDMASNFSTTLEDREVNNSSAMQYLNEYKAQQVVEEVDEEVEIPDSITGKIIRAPEINTFAHTDTPTEDGLSLLQSILALPKTLYDSSTRSVNYIANLNQKAGDAVVDFASDAYQGTIGPILQNTMPVAYFDESNPKHAEALDFVKTIKQVMLAAPTEGRKTTKQVMRGAADMPQTTIQKTIDFGKDILNYHLKSLMQKHFYPDSKIEDLPDLISQDEWKFDILKTRFPAKGTPEYEASSPQLQAYYDEVNASTAFHLSRELTSWFGGYMVAKNVVKKVTTKEVPKADTLISKFAAGSKNLFMTEVLPGAFASANIDPTMGNLSTVMKQMKWVDEDNALTNWFDVGVTKDSQSEKRLEQRFKTGIEDGILTVGIVALIKGITKSPEAAKWFKEFLKDSDPAAIQNTIEKMINPLGLPGQPKLTKELFAGGVAQTADTGLLGTAKKMINEGADVDAVWKETGWKIGQDGKWRFEINDSVATIKDFKVPKIGYTTLDKVINHPELFKAYPQLRNMRIKLSTKLKNHELGAYVETNALDRLFFKRDFIVMNAKHIGSEEFISTLLHEVQHAIQKIEKFAKGGSKNQFVKASQGKQTKAQNIVDFSNRQLEEMSARARQLHILKNTSANAERPAIEAEIKALKQDYDELKVYRDKHGIDADVNVSEEVYQKYLNLAGEAEARETQRRMTWTAQMRKDNPPIWAGVKDEDVIVQFKTGDAQEMTVLHGSTKKFEAIDTGEQRTGLLGNGHYVTTSEKQARVYAGARHGSYEDDLAAKFKQAVDSNDELAISIWDDIGSNDSTPAELRKKFANNPAAAKIIDEYENMLPGYVYKQEIPDDIIEKSLHYKSLDQSKFVMKAIQDIKKEIGVVYDYYDGRSIMAAITRQLGSEDAAKQMLGKHGIKANYQLNIDGDVKSDIIMMYDLKDIQLLSRDGVGVKQNFGVLNVEAIPSEDFINIQNIPTAQKREFSQAMHKIFVNDQGEDILANALGITVKKTTTGSGEWKGGVNPNWHPTWEVPEGGITKEFINKLDTYADIVGSVLKQDGVGWKINYAPRSFVKINNKELYSPDSIFLPEVKLTDKQIKLLQSKIGNATLEVTDGGGIHIVNYYDGGNPVVQDLLVKLDRLPPGPSSQRIMQERDIRLASHNFMKKVREALDELKLDITSTILYNKQSNLRMVGDHYNWENQDDIFKRIDGDTIFKRIDGSRTGSSGQRGDSISSGNGKVHSASGSSDLRGIVTQLENSAKGVRKEYSKKQSWKVKKTSDKKGSK